MQLLEGKPHRVNTTLPPSAYSATQYSVQKENKQEEGEGRGYGKEAGKGMDNEEDDVVTWPSFNLLFACQDCVHPW